MVCPCPAHHVPDWQPDRVLLLYRVIWVRPDRLINVKDTHTQTGAWLRSGEAIGWLAAGTMPNSVYQVSLSYLFLACALCCCYIVHFFLSFLSFVLFCFVLMLSLELCRCSSDLFLSSRPRTVPDWQPRILLMGMVEVRSVNRVKNTTTTTTTTTTYTFCRVWSEPFLRDEYHRCPLGRTNASGTEWQG